MGRNREACMKKLPGVRICNHCTLREENHAWAFRIEGNYGILHGRTVAAKCRHWKDEIEMKEGFAQWSCTGRFLRVCAFGKQNQREILVVSLSVQIFPAFQHSARITKLWMYYGDQTFCERRIISSVKSCFNYAEFRTVVQFFGDHGYVASMLDHGIITTFYTWFFSSERNSWHPSFGQSPTFLTVINLHFWDLEFRQFIF